MITASSLVRAVVAGSATSVALGQYYGWSENCRYIAWRPTMKSTVHVHYDIDVYHPETGDQCS